LLTLATPLSTLPDALSSLGARLLDDGLRLTCPLGDRSASTLLAAVAQHCPAVTELRTEQPTLEQVFLTLTQGRA
jgi:hypothetical protein